jgi:two-component system phosphate regulon response regulator PhoB
MAARVLLIEDDRSLSTLLEYNFKVEGYDVVTAASAEEGELLLAEQHVDLIVLDWMLPAMSGREFCARLRRAGRFPQLSVLMLTARGEEVDKLRGLEAGADDFLTKPFSVPELLARVRALIRRSAPERISEILAVSDITLDRATHRVRRGERIVGLRPAEYKLLEFMLENAGRVLTRSQLLDRVWGNKAEIDERSVDVHIGRLRGALVRGKERDPIRTVRGVGYSLDGDSDR